MDYQAVSPQDHLSPSYVGPINPSPFLSESEYGPIELNSIHTTTDVNSIGNLVLSNSENHSLAPPLWSIFEDSWLLEVIALAISAGALCGIYVLLKLYDGNQIPMWGPITLNALISVLSTLASICVLYAANNGISQLKWIWFAEKKQRLADLRTFDKASRGPKGALELLVKINIRFVLQNNPSPERPERTDCLKKRPSHVGSFGSDSCGGLRLLCPESRPLLY